MIHTDEDDEFERIAHESTDLDDSGGLGCVRLTIEGFIQGDLSEGRVFGFDKMTRDTKGQTRMFLGVSAGEHAGAGQV